jgi:hypothetical protein
VRDDEPYDYLGQLFSEQDCAIDRLGQVMTPPWIVSYINDSVIGKVAEMEEGTEERWKVVLDPCTGTGRFLLDLACRHRDRCCSSRARPAVARPPSSPSSPAALRKPTPTW